MQLRIPPQNLLSTCEVLKKSSFYNSVTLRESILAVVNSGVTEKETKISFSHLLQCIKDITDPWTRTHVDLVQLITPPSRPGRWSSVCHLDALLDYFITVTKKLSDNDFIDMAECAVRLGLNVTRFLEVFLCEIEQRLCVQSNATDDAATYVANTSRVAETRYFLQSHWVANKKQRALLIRAITLLSEIEHYRNNGKEIFQSKYVFKIYLDAF